MGSRDIYVKGYSQLMGTKCETLGFSHSVWKGVSMILSVNITSYHHLDLNLVSHTHKGYAWKTYINLIIN